MSEEKTAGQLKPETENISEAVTGETVESTEKTAEKFVPSSQSVADKMEEKVFGAPEEETESTEETEGETTESSSEEESTESTEETVGTETTEESSTSEEIEVKKDNVQKRIDQLTAQKNEALAANKKLEERLSKLEEAKSEGKKDKEFTDAELRTAMKKAVEEGDADLIMDIQDYRLDKLEKGLIAKYENANKSQTDAAAKKNKEWQSIVLDFSPDSYTDEALKENPDFDISNNTSKLFTEAKKLFETSDKYQKLSNGMRQAVDDAFKDLLLKLISKKKDSKETKGLKNILAKTKRKQSLGSGADTTGDDELPVSKSDAEDLADVIKERREFKNSRISTGV